MATILDSIDSFEVSAYTERERMFLHRLRVMLKDVPNDVYRSLNTLVEEQRGERWSDDQLYVYLLQAASDINAEPPHSTITIETCPANWEACMVMGGMIFALISEGILQVGEQFSYSDNGISLNINLAQGYQSIAQTLLNSYQQMKKDIKRAMRPKAAGAKSSPAPVRIRSYAPRMWTYR